MNKYILTLSTASLNQLNLFGSGRPISLKKLYTSRCAGLENTFFQNSHTAAFLAYKHENRVQHTMFNDQMRDNQPQHLYCVT